MEKTIHRKVIDVNIGMPNEEELAARYGIQEKNETENNSIYKQNEAENDVIREQKQTIEKLLRKINEKNSKIDQLCTLLEVLEPIPGFSPEKYRKILNGEVDEALIDHRDSKIVSLAKKAQNLTMLLNKERASNENHRQQVAQLQASCNKFNDQITQLSEELRAKGSSRKTATTIRGEDEAILTRKELKESKNTIEEQKKRIAELVESEKALNKALEREVGEGVTAAQALSGDWRGRAQQIVMLKAKLKRLESKTQMGDSTNRKNDVDHQAEADLVEMSKERRHAIEALTEERQRLVEENSTLAKKNSAHKARTQILESNIAKMKDSMQVVLNKSSTDDQLIEALRAEISKLRFEVNKVAEVTKMATKEEAPVQQDQNLLMEIQRLKRLCKAQAEQLETQNSTLQRLRNK